MRVRTLSPVLALCLLMAGAPALAETWQHDEYSANPNEVIQETEGVSMGAHPGFISGEAFGQIYTPEAGDYPVTIDGFDLIAMGPPEAPEYQAHLTIEIFIDPGTPGEAGPTNTSPDFTISTSDMAASIGGVLNDKGQVKAGTFYSATFDTDDSDGHPPVVQAGNRVWLMVRYQTPASSTVGWDGCATGCGCQSLVVPVDTDGITPGVNVMHITLAGCGGTATDWWFQEDLVAFLGPGAPKGDWLMRLQVSPGGGGGGCDCAGKQCGSDGCGGSCGACPNGTVCVQGSCNDDGGGGCDSDCAGKDCGDDGCSGVCGLCGGEEVCIQGVCTDPGGGGCDSDCAGKDCGADGCGGVCGLCGSDEECVQGTCTEVPPDCEPECGGKECGSDGCGDLCGYCEGETYCASGGCLPIDGGGAGNLGVTGVSPSEGFVDESTAIAISGSGFHDGMKVRLGTVQLGVTGRTGTTLLDALVPSDMIAGTYNLIVISADESQTATLNDAFTAVARVECGDGACADSETCLGCAIDCGPCEEETPAPSGGCAGGTSPPWAGLLGLLVLAALGRRPRRA